MNQSNHGQSHWAHQDSTIMGSDDVKVECQEEYSFLHDQKHQEYMRAALDMVSLG